MCLCDHSLCYKHPCDKYFFVVYSSGSVIVNGQAEITEKVNTSQLEDSFRTFLRGQNFVISGDTIDPASIHIEGKSKTTCHLHKL